MDCNIASFKTWWCELNKHKSYLYVVFTFLDYINIHFQSLCMRSWVNGEAIFIISTLQRPSIWIFKFCCCVASSRIKVRSHLTTIRWKTPDCSQSRTLQQQVANYFHKHHGRLFGRNFVDDCPLFWFAAVSAVCKQCILLTICFTVYLLLIYPCK